MESIKEKRFDGEFMKLWGPDWEGKLLGDLYGWETFLNFAQNLKLIPLFSSILHQPTNVSVG